MLSGSEALLALYLLLRYNLSIYEGDISCMIDFTLLFTVYLQVNSVTPQPAILGLGKYKLYFKFLSSC